MPKLELSSPGKLLKQGLAADGGHATEVSEHMIYSEQAIVVPPRRMATVWLRAPLQLKDKECDCLVEPLSTAKKGIDLDVPTVECRAVRPDSRHRVPVAIWNTSGKALHVPAFSPVATLTAEFEVTGMGPTNCQPSRRTYDQLDASQKALIDSVTG